MAPNLRTLGAAVLRTLRLLDRLSGPAGGQSRTQAPARPGRKSGTRPPGPAGTPAAQPGTGYAGDFRGKAEIRYAPSPNGRPEPGEIVWAWVPYEEDHTRGKDRPVLLVGVNGRHLLGLMLTSRDHDDDPHAADDYVDIGTGPWDRQRRPSEVKLDRVIRISPSDVRREGAILDAQRFGEVAAALRGRHGWS